MFQLFGDTGMTYMNPEFTNRGHAFFFDGGIDLFFTARVGDNFRVLSETVFLTLVGDASDTSKFDQERLWGAWQVSDLFQAKLGLEHSPISRWNSLYHHGRWLELTVARPLLANFEAANGVLPMHDAGLELSGALEAGRTRISYFLFISNGRGPLITDVQEFSDKNDAKAFTLGMGFQPPGPHPLFIGFVLRYDEIPPNPADPARVRSIGEFIGSSQVDYRGEMLQILSEVAWVQDDDKASGTTFDHIMAYLQAGFSLDDEWTPYVRFDVLDMDRGDPYYAAANRDMDVWEIVLGVRFDFIDNAAVKLETGFGDRESRDGGGVVSTHRYIRIGLQLAFVF
jgi:hypothetical protein